MYILLSDCIRILEKCGPQEELKEMMMMTTMKVHAHFLAGHNKALFFLWTLRCHLHIPGLSVSIRFFEPVAGWVFGSKRSRSSIGMRPTGIKH